MSRFLRDVRDGNLAAVQRHLTTNPSAARATEPGVRSACHQCVALSLLISLKALLSHQAEVGEREEQKHYS